MDIVIVQFIVGFVRLFWIIRLGRQLSTCRCVSLQILNFALLLLSRQPFIGFVLNSLRKLRSVFLSSCQVLVSVGYREFKLHLFYLFVGWKLIVLASYIIYQASFVMVTTLTCNRLSAV